MSTNNTCANCGKGEECSGDLKSCTACKLVKYCNRECQIAHRPQHKKECKKRAAELRDEKLFKQPPPPEECPICMLPPPLIVNYTGMAFFSCCGKRICNGCELAMEESGAKDLCAYCRTPYTNSHKEQNERLKKLMEKGNARAFNQLAGYYAQGILGMPQNWAKANELYLKAGELGCADGYSNLGCSYRTGDGVEIDTKKANHYLELAAMNGSVQARYNLGALEGQTGNYQQTLDNVEKGFMHGYVTKDQYANTLREYQKSQDEMKSEARDKALAAHNQRMGG